MDRYVCIHGHFYQPPRDNPWLGSVEQEDSAYPYHDWNDRVTAECYEPNTASRILHPDGRIVSIANNYARISFNFGPTLIGWMDENRASVVRSIVEADRESRERFSGHGSAIAQAFNHTILPLMNSRDKRTQIAWGVADFVHRFGRRPESMWLPETAVDLESLELLAEHGIAFTILAPRQASRVRPIGASEWQDVSGERIDPTRAYVCRLPSGRSIALFFYDGPVSRAVAFEKLLTNGELFAKRLASAFNEARDWPQLVHIATDGETYGHHHKNGDMALAFALHTIEETGLAKLTNYGEFLERHPPTHEVEIFENSSWSCIHGVERWRADCGCNSGMNGGWHQKWRGPLRAALDGLRDSLAPAWERSAGELLREPWAARDDYASVILDRSPDNIGRFLERHATRSLEAHERVAALKLLELQRHALTMYTSCGWFFDEVSGIEAVQVLKHAGCAIQLADEVLSERVEAEFLARLEAAPSNLPEHGNGRRVYEKFVKPASVDLVKVAAHYAVASLFETFGEVARVHSFTVERRDGNVAAAGKAKLSTGAIRVASAITGESAELCYGVLHLGDHNITGGVRHMPGLPAYREMVDSVVEPFARADVPEVIRRLDRSFLELTYSLKSLFKDEQRRVLGLVLETTLSEAEAVYRQLYDHHAPLLRFLIELGAPLPRPFKEAATVVLNGELRRAIAGEPLDLERVRSLLDEARRAKAAFDAPGLAWTIQRRLEAMVEALRATPGDGELLAKLRALAELARSLPFDVDLWRVQNLYWEISRGESAPRDEPFVALGTALGVRVAA